jgi:hypothetical protein
VLVPRILVRCDRLVETGLPGLETRQAASLPSGVNLANHRHLIDLFETGELRLTDCPA